MEGSARSIVEPKGRPPGRIPEAVALPFTRGEGLSMRSAEVYFKIKVLDPTAAPRIRVVSLMSSLVSWLTSPSFI